MKDRWEPHLLWIGWYRNWHLRLEWPRLRNFYYPSGLWECRGFNWLVGPLVVSLTWDWRLIKDDLAL